ncbi:ribonuclease H-like domain-containing protein [Candidatus Woesearchaeota archaeon]|nr:ribonuclease H-like domain-containing protein [Candidatus Woesearchaeota archaeon]
MAKIAFNPVEATYKIIDGSPVVELYGKSSGKQVCVQFHGFEPYFWALGESEITDEKITKIEKHKKSFLGKEVEAKKVFVKIPADVPAVREKSDSLEADIPFARRFLIDRKITPLATYEADGAFVESDYKCEVFRAEKIGIVSEEISEQKVLAVDIETHTDFGKEIIPENDPIIMIALHGNNFRKVLTWKHFDNNLGYIEVVDSEVEMLERFRELVEEYKPDILTGYFSDGFDLPYLKARADKYRTNMKLGLDNSEIMLRKGNVPVAEITGIAHIDIFKFVKRMFRTAFTSFKLNDVAQELLGQGKAQVKLEELYASWNEEKGLEKFAEYNLTDAKLTYELCIKLWPNITELTKMIGVPPAEASRMSFSQLVEWYLIKEAHEFNELVPNRPDFSEERKRRVESYTGGYVYEPTPGLYKDIVVYDFRSLYPTIISAHNISPDRIILGKDSEDGVLKGISFGKEKGFISTVIDNVINRRLRIKEMAKGKEDKSLEARQQALKTVANSIYGYYGFFGARWYNLDCAKAITAYGRHHMQDVIEKAKTVGFNVIYGDTDSIMLALEGKHISAASKFVEGINKKLPGIMELEFEGLYKSGIFVATKGRETGAKKRYALMDEEGKMKVRGFETVRRNLSLIAKQTQQKALEMILQGKTSNEVAEFVKDVVKQLRSKQTETRMVVIKTQISRDIKSYANIPPHVAIAKRMQEQGKKVGPGTMVSYVVAEGKGVIRDRSKLPEEVAAGEYDAEYYVRNQVLPAVGKLMEVIGYNPEELLEERQQKKLETFFG